MLDLLLDMTSLDHEFPRVLGDPALLGHAVRWLKGLGGGMSDDRKQLKVVISSVHIPGNIFALACPGATG